MDSLSLLDAARRAGLQVSVDGDRLVVRGPRSAGSIAEQLLEHKQDLIQLLSQEDSRLHSEFERTGRLRIETTEGGAWLVSSWERADHIREGGVYCLDTWPDFVALSPQEQRQIHSFLTRLRGGRFDHVEPADHISKSESHGDDDA